MAYYLTAPQGLGGLLPAEEQKVAAQAIAAKVTGKSSGKSFETAVKIADFGMNQVGLAADYLGQTTAGKSIKQTGVAGAMAFSIVSNVRSGKYKADASGIVDAAGDIEGFLGAVAGVITTVSGGPSRVANEIKDWASVGAACAIGGAAVAFDPTMVGKVIGGIACAFSVLAKALSMTFGSSPPRAHDSQPRSTFCMYGENKQHIAADALRLAKVLRFHYGAKSAPQLFDQSLAIGRFQWINQIGYPSRPPADANGTLQSPEKPIPAHNLATILQMLDVQQSGRDVHQANINIRDCLAAMACYLTNIERGGRGLYLRFYEDDDINERTIAAAAYLGRCAVGTYGDARVKAGIITGGNTATWPGKSGTVIIDLLPFIVLDELINFFAAVTSVEFSQYGIDHMQKYRIGALNPVRLMTVRDGDTSGQLEGVESPYSSKCATNLMRVEPCGKVDDQAASGGLRALREYGTMRLMAAFSYLHMMWDWSHDNDSARVDPFAMEEVRDEITAPVDPRQVTRTSDGGLALRSIDGMVPDAPNSTVARFFGGLGDNEKHRNVAGNNPGNTVAIAPYTGNSFATKYASPGDGKHRESSVGVVFLKNVILEHNKLVEDVMRNAVGGITVQQMISVFQTHKDLIANYTTDVSQLVANIRKAQPGLFASVAKKQDSGAVIIGAAALAALLLLR